MNVLHWMSENPILTVFILGMILSCNPIVFGCRRECCRKGGAK